jgi:hypothetical protein
MFGARPMREPPSSLCYETAFGNRGMDASHRLLPRSNGEDIPANVVTSRRGVPYAGRVDMGLCAAASVLKRSAAHAALLAWTRTGGGEIVRTGGGGGGGGGGGSQFIGRASGTDILRRRGCSVLALRICTD